MTLKNARYCKELIIAAMAGTVLALSVDADAGRALNRHRQLVNRTQARAAMVAQPQLAHGDFVVVCNQFCDHRHGVCVVRTIGRDDRLHNGRHGFVFDRHNVGPHQRGLAKHHRRGR